MIKVNKGEWSELYVFLRLLGDGVLYAANEKLDKINELYYPLIEIPREENKNIKHYIKEEADIKIIDEEGNILLKLPASEFKKRAFILLNAIKNSTGTFSVTEIENFMKTIYCTKVKADSTDKSDITLVLHDYKTYKNEKFGFSIKSRLGSSSTLLNAGYPTNFIYEITSNLTEEQIKKINEIDTKSKIRDRLKKLSELNCKLKFYRTENAVFNANLQMIDSLFPKIISEYLLLYYTNQGKLISELTDKIKEINPCNLDTTLPHAYYEYKIKNFLTDVALGMTAATPWNGFYQATGGYIVVREDGEVFCYHIYNHNESQEYLYKNTRFETPSTKKYNFGKIYKENNKKYIKLNLQIRFI